MEVVWREGEVFKDWKDSVIVYTSVQKGATSNPVTTGENLA